MPLLLRRREILAGVSDRQRWWTVTKTNDALASAQSQAPIQALAMFIGGLAALIGARWAATSMSLTGTVLMVAIYALMPKARQIQ